MERKSPPLQENREGAKSMLEKGTQAPDFILQDKEGRDVKLSD